jgi:hypothetical protein
MELVSFVIAAWSLLIAGRAVAADLHPIVQVQSGYLFGATADGKWVKAEEAAKALRGETSYHVYGLTQSLGQAKGAKPKPSEEDVCSDVLTVSLSPKPAKGVIALAAPWNALPRKARATDPTQKVYVDAIFRHFTEFLHFVVPLASADDASINLRKRVHEFVGRVGAAGEHCRG